MARYRDALPQLKDPTRLFLTDGGIETTLIFHDGLELRDFAAFDALKSPEGRAALEKYFRAYAEVAKRLGAGLILESATWRASPDWGKRLGYSGGTLAHANHKAIAMLEAIRDESASARDHVRLKRALPGLVVFGGCCGTDDCHVGAIGEACAPLFASDALSRQSGGER